MRLEVGLSQILEREAYRISWRSGTGREVSMNFGELVRTGLPAFDVDPRKSNGYFASSSPKPISCYPSDTPTGLKGPIVVTLAGGAPDMARDSPNTEFFQSSSKDPARPFYQEAAAGSPAAALAGREFPGESLVRFLAFEWYDIFYMALVARSAASGTVYFLKHLRWWLSYDAQFPIDGGTPVVTATANAERARDGAPDAPVAFMLLSVASRPPYTATDLARSAVVAAQLK